MKQVTNNMHLKYNPILSTDSSHLSSRKIRVALILNHHRSVKQEHNQFKLFYMRGGQTTRNLLAFQSFANF